MAAFGKGQSRIRTSAASLSMRSRRSRTRATPSPDARSGVATKVSATTAPEVATWSMVARWHSRPVPCARAFSAVASRCSPRPGRRTQPSTTRHRAARRAGALRRSRWRRATNAASSSSSTKSAAPAKPSPARGGYRRLATSGRRCATSARSPPPEHVRRPGQVEPLGPGRRHGVAGVTGEQQATVAQRGLDEAAERQHGSFDDRPLVQAEAVFAGQPQLELLPDPVVRPGPRVLGRVALEYSRWMSDVRWLIRSNP